MGVSGMAGCTPRRARSLNVYNWSVYIAPETVPNFEREFNASVRYLTFESAEEMLAKVAAGNSGWDIVFPSNSFIAPMREQGLLMRMDHAALPNIQHLEPWFQNPSWDPGLQWSVPYMHGSTGIVYNRSISPPPVAWADFWQDRYGRRVTMMDESAEVIGACLKKRGDSINSVDPAQLQQAKLQAITAKGLLRAYISAEVRDQVVSGDVLMAQMWAQMGKLACNERSELAYVHPAEGFALYADNIVILRESRRVELAHEFVNYLLRPEVSARIAQSVTTATPNATARRLLPRALGEDPILYPPPEVLARGEWFEAMPASGQRLRDRIWTEIKSA